MKKILASLMIICAAVLSCKKDHKNEVKPVVAGTTHQVAFKVGFSQTLTNFGTSRLKLNSTTPDTSLTDHMDVLYFMVFDSVGNNLRTIKQLSSDTSFGRYTDNLHPGKYTVIVAGGKTGLAAGSSSTDSGNALDKAIIFYTITQNGNTGVIPFTQDAFYQKISMTVTNANSNQSISLSRIVSKLVVNINDPIPAGAGYIATKIAGVANAFYVNSGTGGNLGANATSATLTTADVGITNYQMSILFLYSGPFRVGITCATSSSVEDLTNFTGTIFGLKTVGNITGQPNKITLLSGDLFGGTGNGGIQISADTTWKTSAPIGF